MKSITTLILVSLILTGCDAQQFGEQLQSEVHAIQILLFGGDSKTSSNKNSRMNSAAMLAQRTKQNAELLQEMYRVVYIREPKSGPEFASLVDTLNQGASIEGIYNGMVYSTSYRGLETAHPGANANTLQFFAEELVRIELNMSKMTVFTSSSAQPLSAPVQPTGTEDEIDFPGKNPQQAPPPVAAATAKPSSDILFKQYLGDFAGASYFTLKRILGDEILKLIEEKSSDQRALAKWYGGFVHRMADYHVDFGLALRNNPDEAFHEGWAMSVSGDQLRWEVLNRVHRVANQMEVSK